METPPPKWQRGFWSLIVTQFQGAFSDNTLWNLAIFVILGLKISNGMRALLIPLVGALFALPFILFSMAGGFFADRFSKRSVTIGVKIFEIAVMLFATAGLALGNVSMQLISVFFMGVHSAIFGPSKYGLLPELLPDKKLSWGNGILEFGTFGAIIFGTSFAAILSDKFRGMQVYSGVILFGLAIFGLVVSLGINRVAPAAPHKRFQANFLKDLKTQIQYMHIDRPLWLSMWGNIYFTFFGALVKVNVVVYGKDLLKLTDTQIGYLWPAAAIGIGIGSLAAGYLSKGKIETRLIPLGSIGMTIFALLLGVPKLSFAMVAVGLILLGIFSGFFIVPISALLQHRPEKDRKGGVLAAANLLSFAGVFIASGAYYLMELCLSPSGVFVCSGVMTLLGTVYVIKLLPESFFGIFHRNSTAAQSARL